jgi:hypothetical protein
VTDARLIARPIGREHMTVAEYCRRPQMGEPSHPRAPRCAARPNSRAHVLCVRPHSSTPTSRCDGRARTLGEARRRRAQRQRGDLHRERRRRLRRRRTLRRTSKEIGHAGDTPP